jgi:2-hydroxy-6-oxonona-2,4-dienedioate hydrolase
VQDHLSGTRPGRRRGRAAKKAMSERARFRTERAIVRGLPMSFRRSLDEAEADGPSVVLVHGLGLSGSYMLPVAERLARRYPVYLPDLPGFGDSAKPARALDVPGLAEALAEWIRAVRLQPVALLGNSFGCQIIADLTARYPDLVERAVLQGPTTPPQDRSWLWQFVRWRQNQPYNPQSLSPITWDDYRKAAIGVCY